MTQELTKRDTTAMTLSDGAPAPASGVLNSDVVVPRLLLMQGLSDFVVERKAQQGDMVRSTPLEVLGGPSTPVEFIPLKIQNLWRIEELVGKRFEFRATEPRTAKNEDLPWDFEQNGTKWRRVKVLNCFAMLPLDIQAEAAEIENFQKTGEMPNLDKTLLPIVISFRSTSYNAGKAVATHFVKAASMAKYGARAYGYTLGLRCYQDKNDQGSYYVFDVGQGRRCTPSEFEQAEKWAKLLDTQAVKVDDTEEVSSSTEESEQF